MDICFQNVPGQITSRQFEATVSKPLKECGVEDFHCQLIRNKNIAFVTVLDRSAGQRFISLYGVQYRGAQPKNHIICHGQRLRCQRGRHEPTAFDLKALEFQASQRLAKVVVTVPQDDKKTRRFNITHLHCGMWDYNSDSQLQYEAHFTKSSAGTITFGLREAIVLLGDVGTDQLRMDFTYYSCENVVLGDPRTPDVTFTLHHSPRFYQVAGEDVLEAAFRAMNLGTAAGRERSIHKERILGLGSDHLSVAGACKVYRLRLSEPSALLKVQDLLKSHPKMPLSYSLPTHVSFSSPPFKKSYILLCNQLTDTAKHGKLPFQLRFQLDRLARNGYLSPLKVLNLLPTVHTLWAEVGADPVALALRKLARSLPLPGPENCDEYSTAWLDSQLRSFVDLYDYHAPDNPYEIARRHQHINLIHRVVITPTSVRLEGPDPEPTNRVLRQYADSTDHFIRVIFTDEDGGSVRYDPRASQRAIYDKRFYGELRKSIIIAGRGFDFLGFSHSALRGHSCWAMAPIAYKGTFHYAPNVLKALGDFEHIRTPAKCAARIGQNFTDTNDTIELKPSNVGELALVTRNGYDFSDGVGTVSQELLSKVWRVYGTKRLLKPTALQIRFQGAKGMVSLDSRVRGEQLLLRSNMKKFETSSSWNLEVCGAAFKPLPMFLNRQLIKLLEDLEVPSQVFFDLQDAAMQRLRFMTESSINTGLFLRQSVSQATHISSLMWHLGEIGLDYHCDLFLRRVVEMAVVTELRDLKYRGRIPVKDGMTLYGIMDETGYLQEGEVFVVTEQQGTPAAAVSFLNGVDQVPNGKQVLVQNNVVITRSPAMHPGDVQLVNAVRVPEDSPLQHLRNVVVFSQHGRRDLPSQLSGGDLDGDLYNVIYDRRLRPAYTHDAAEYPRLPPAELKRPVIADDMIKHMLLFMETDQLGMISNVHLQLADQKELGTNDPDCVKIAKMASIAVDFSKTGIAVDMSQLPRYNRLRPDFMAPNPRLFISGSGKLELEDPVEGEDEAFEGIDEERKPMRYYRSEKVLGHLYRNIDENKFLADLQQQHYAHSKGAGISPDLRETLCEYVLHHAKMYSVLYENYMDLARDIRAGYEDSLLDILYQYSPTSYGPITETEAYAGTILGRQGGAQGKPLRDLNKAMRERFEPVAEYATMRIINGDAAMQEAEYLDDLYDIQEREIEAWPRAIACVVVACREKGLEDRRLGELKSFAYIALAVCLKEFERTRMGLGRHGTLPELSA